MKVGIVANPHKSGAVRTLEKLVAMLGEHGMDALYETETAQMISCDGGLAGPELARASDVIAVLGGDGTMLHATSILGGTDKPIAGINIGTLGFLTSCTDAEIGQFCTALKNGCYETSRRTLLCATVESHDGTRKKMFGLNETVLARAQTGRIGAMRVLVDGELLNRYRADGLIVATPTGSTAYSLSAGGPLISPSAGVFVITPVCPHTLSQRSLVVDDDVTIELAPDSAEDGPLCFTVDGRDCVDIPLGDRVIVQKADHDLHLLRLPGRTFYNAVRQKLNWRGG